MRETVGTAMPGTTLLLVVVGGVLALTGTYWDEAWHTHVGRDSLFSPPHLLLYVGVAAPLAGVGWWAVALRRFGGLGAWRREPALLLATTGAAVTIAGAPVDEAWHALFGRDAVLWSPPHMVGVIGMLLLSAGVLIGAARTSTATRGIVLVAAGLLGAAMVPVMEYEADVPQFAAVWYVPVLVAGGILAFVLIEHAHPRPWTVTAAAGAYTVLRLGVVGFLSLQGLSAAFVPPVVVPALAFDLTRGVTPAKRAGVVVAAFVAAYAPTMNVLYRGVRLSLVDVLVGGTLAMGVAWLVLSAISMSPDRRPRHRHALIGSPLVVLALLAPTSVWAHDPGQGEAVAPVTLHASLAPDRAHLEATLDHPGCHDLQPHAAIARRAGRTQFGKLVSIGPCEFAGSVALDEPGRWFLYLEVVDGAGKVIEAWIPATPPDVGDPPAVAIKHDWAYHPAGADRATAGQVSAGVVLYVLSAGLLMLLLRVASRSEERQQAANPRRPDDGRGTRRRSGLEAEGANGDGIQPPPEAPGQG